MTTNSSALERARNSPRVQRALRGMARTMFYLAIATISLVWTMMIPLVLFSAGPDPLRVAALFVVPGGVWLIVWYERRGDAKEAATAPFSPVDFRSWLVNTKTRPREVAQINSITWSAVSLLNRS